MKSVTITFGCSLMDVDAVCINGIRAGSDREVNNRMLKGTQFLSREFGIFPSSGTTSS
jgi:hypothetical protein